jgi:hypothetical protein
MQRLSISAMMMVIRFIVIDFSLWSRLWLEQYEKGCPDGQSPDSLVMDLE